MSIEKSELKALIANNLGADFEDRAEALQREFHQLTGAWQALDQAGTKVPVQVAAKIKAALEEGAIEEGMPALKIAEFAIKQVMKCGDFLRHLSEEERKKQIVLTGRIEGIKDAMTMVLKMRDDEVAKGQAAAKAESEGKPLRGNARPSGVRPGPSGASLRKSSAQADTAAGETQAHTPAGEEAARKTHGSLAERRAKGKADKAKAAEAAGTNGKPQKPQKKRASRKKVTARRKSAAG